MIEGAPGAEGGLGEVIQDFHSAAVDDLDSSDDSLRERVLKIIADRDVRSSGLQQEGRDMGAPLTASGEEQAQPAGSSQIAYASSSNDAMLGMGIQVRRTRYFLLFEIDGLFMWQFFGQVGPLRDSLGLTIQREMHYFLRLGLKEFLEFCLINFEVIFWTTTDTKTLEPQYEKLL